MLELSRAFSIPCPLQLLHPNFHCKKHKNKFVNQIVMAHRNETFACNAIFMFCKKRRFQQLPCGFMRFHHTTINRLWILFWCNFLLCKHIRGASMNHSLARHGKIICDLLQPFRKISQKVVRISTVIPLFIFVFGFLRVVCTSLLSQVCHFALLLDLLKMQPMSPAVAMYKTSWYQNWMTTLE